MSSRRLIAASRCFTGTPTSTQPYPIVKNKSVRWRAPSAQPYLHSGSMLRWPLRLHGNQAPLASNWIKFDDTLTSFDVAGKHQTSPNLDPVLPIKPNQRN